MRSVFAIVLSLVLVAGCAQNTETPIDQQTQQAQITPTASEQDTATAGSTIYVYVMNAPAKAGLPPAMLSDVFVDNNGVSTGPLVLDETPAGDERTYAGFIQKEVTVNITTGGTTPTVSGTTTGTATATQTPTASQTVYPHQEVRPEASVAVPVGVAMPGGVVDQQATAVGHEGQASPTKESDIETHTLIQQLRGEVDKLREALDFLRQTVERVLPAPTSQPAPVTEEAGSAGAGD